MNESLNFSSHAEYLQATTRGEFLGLLDKAGSVRAKILVIEKSLISVLDLSFKFSQLEAAGVTRIVEWTDEWTEQPTGDDSVYIYITRSLSKDSLPLFTQLAEKIRKRQKRPSRLLCFAPFLCNLSLNRLRALGVSPEAEFLEIVALRSLSHCALEDDVISMQLGDDSFSDFNCRTDPSLLLHVAHLVQSIQREFGIGVGHEEILPRQRRIRKINAIGTASKLIADVFLRLTQSGGGDHRIVDEQQTVPHFDAEEITGGLSRLGGIETLAGLVDSGACASGDVVHEVAHAESEKKPEISSPQAIDSVVLIDRRTDLYSLLCSQFTYESLVDEEFGISNNKVKFTPPAGDSSPTSQSANPQPVSLTLSKKADPLFAQVRDVSVSAIGQLLSKKATYIADCYKEKDALKSISEIKEFMGKFKHIQAEHASLSSHVSLATAVSAFTRDSNYTWMLKLEDQIMSMSKPVGKILSKIDSMVHRSTMLPLFTLERILRLLCLCSLVYGPKAFTSGGVEKVLKSIVHVNGFGAIRVLHHLEQAGLLRFYNPAEASGVMSELMSSSSKWPKIREEFKLISGEATDELAQAYAGYIPLSVRLVQLLNTSWKASAEKLNLLRGPALEISQECPIATGSSGNCLYVAVVFVGGVTYGEIAALRKLSALEGGRRKFLIITTSITNAARIVRNM